MAQNPAPAAPDGRFPQQPLHHLDTLWIQVAGTLCNLSCTHCLVTSGPGEDRHAMMSREDVRARLAEGLALGVKEVYFTGGEPFLNREMDAILDDTLTLAPATVLTNGTLFTQRRVAFLRDLAARSRFSLELRVSFDGADAAAHDTFRGPGSFVRAMDGLRAVSAAGLLPIATVTQAGDEDALEFRERWFRLLRAQGIEYPRLKVLPMFQLGREEHRTRAYRGSESLALLPAEAFDPHRMQCGSCRAVTSQGVFPCPLLIDAPRARMGDTLAGANGAFTLDHGACHTCWVTGMTCGNG